MTYSSASLSYPNLNTLAHIPGFLLNLNTTVTVSPAFPLTFSAITSNEPSFLKLFAEASPPTTTEPFIPVAGIVTALILEKSSHSIVIGYVPAQDNEPEVEEISIRNEKDNKTYSIFENEVKNIKILENIEK